MIGASDSDNQMLCESSGARAAPSIAAQKNDRNRKVYHSSFKFVLGTEIFKEKKRIYVMHCSSILTCYSKKSCQMCTVLSESFNCGVDSALITLRVTKQTLASI